MQTFVVADYHLGETRLELLNRPFENEQELWEAIRRNHNEVVAPEDKVVIVGDVVAANANNPQLWLEKIKELNGEKMLIRGNHDRMWNDEQLKPYFTTIIPEGSGIEIDVRGIPCYITHYPTCGVTDRFNIVGHIHSAWKVQLNMWNCGVDVNHFRPSNIEKVEFVFNTILNVYDDDVWCAYCDANQNHRDRGKKESRFDKTMHDFCRMSMSALNDWVHYANI